MLKAVILDSKEPASIKALDFGVPTLVQPLKCGDCWLATDSTTLVVERKTLSDLLASIRDGRLFDQAARLVAQSKWCYEVITELPVVRSGCVFLNGKMSEWKWASVQGALLTLQEMGVEVVWWEGGYVQCLQWLADRSRDTVHVKPQRRDIVMESPAETVLCSLPGISDGRAGALLEHCGTAAFALQFLTGNGGGSIPGIGPGTKTAVRSALGLTDDLVLTVVGKEETA